MTSFILLAGGSGSRIRKEVPKQFLLLAGKPIIMHTMEKLEQIQEILEVVVVCLSEYKNVVEEYVKTYDLRKSYRIIDGGLTRQESVLRGLHAAQYDTVVLHESARPLVRQSEFLEIIQCEYKNVTYGREIPFTVLQKENGLISGLLDRNSLVNVQLPQKFEKSILLRAHEKAQKCADAFTEDASMIYHYENAKVNVIEGSEYNIKLTTWSDVLLAEELYKEAGLW